MWCIQLKEIVHATCWSLGGISYRSINFCAAGNLLIMVFRLGCTAKVCILTFNELGSFGTKVETINKSLLNKGFYRQIKISSTKHLKRGIGMSFLTVLDALSAYYVTLRLRKKI